MCTTYHLITFQTDVHHGNARFYFVQQFFHIFLWMRAIVTGFKVDSWIEEKIYTEMLLICNFLRTLNFLSAENVRNDSKPKRNDFFLFLRWIKRIQDWKRQPIKIQFPDKKKKWFWRKNVFEFNRFQRVFHSIFQLILSRASIELVLTKLWLHTKWWTTWNWVWSVAIDFKALLSPPFRCFTADFHVCARQTHYEKCAHFVMCRLAIYAHSIHNNDCIRVPARAIVVAAVRMYACSNCISEQIANRRVSW